MYNPVRIPQLDGLRGFAMILVVTHHYIGDLGMTPATEPWLLGLRAILHSSWIAGDILFVLSGFLITRIVIVHGQKKNFLPVFYLRRGTRTVIPYYLFLTVCFFATFFFENGDDTPWLFYLFHLQALSLAVSLTLPHMVVLWTLTWEEWFYVWVPIFRRGGVRMLRNWAVLGLMLAPVVRYLHSVFIPQSWEYAFVLRPDGLFYGIVLALIATDARLKARWEAKRGQQSFLAGLGIGILILISYGWWHHPPLPAWGMNLIFCLVPFTAFLILSMTVLGGSQFWWNRFLATQPLQFIGRISVGVYFYHELFRLIAQKYLGQDSVTAILAALLATVALAILSWTKLEQPLIRFGHQFDYGTSWLTIRNALFGRLRLSTSR